MTSLLASIFCPLKITVWRIKHHCYIARMKTILHEVATENVVGIDEVFFISHLY